MTSQQARPRRTVEVGRIIVHLDSHDNPYRFERDGHEVGCVCQDRPRVVCLYHLRHKEARP